MYLSIDDEAYKRLNIGRASIVQGLGTVLGMVTASIIGGDDSRDEAIRLGVKDGNFQGDGLRFGGTFIINDKGTVLAEKVQKNFKDSFSNKEIISVLGEAGLLHDDHVDILVKARAISSEEVDTVLLSPSPPNTSRPLSEGGGSGHGHGKDRTSVPLTSGTISSSDTSSSSSSLLSKRMDKLRKIDDEVTMDEMFKQSIKSLALPSDSVDTSLSLSSLGITGECCQLDADDLKEIEEMRALFR